MSVAPFPAARPPPAAVCHPPGFPALSSCRRFLARPGRRPRRCAAAGAPPGPARHRQRGASRRPTAKNEERVCPLVPAPVFIERLEVRLREDAGLVLDREARRFACSVWRRMGDSNPRGLAPNTLSKSDRRCPRASVVVLTCGSVSRADDDGHRRTALNETAIETVVWILRR